MTHEPSTEADTATLPPPWLGLLANTFSNTGAEAQDAMLLTGIKTKLMARIRQQEPAHRVVRDHEQWLQLDANIQVKVLHKDAHTLSWLMKLLPNTRIPAHAHTYGEEECVVVSGSVVIDGELLHAGDFTVASKGSHHNELYTLDGCLLYLKSPAIQEKMLPHLRSVAV